MLAVSSEPAEKVVPYVESFDLPFPVAAGSSTGAALAKLTGAGTIPHSFLVDPEGRLVWHGHPSALSGKLLARVLRRAEKPGPKDPIAWRGTVPEAPSEALAAAAEGELRDALEALAEKPSPGAADLRERLEAHVALLTRQIEEALSERRAVRASLETLDLLADELRGHPLGEPPAARLAEARADESLQAELDAEVALERALEHGRRRGMKKARILLERITDRYPGTRAAERAARILKDR